MNKKLLIGGLALGSIAFLSFVDIREKPTHLCTFSDPSFQEKIRADCSKIYAGKDFVRGIYDGKSLDYEWFCFRIKNQEDEQKARTIIEKYYLPSKGYDLNQYLFPERIFCSVEGIHQR